MGQGSRETQGKLGMAANITTASVKVGLDASTFKSGVQNLKASLGGLDNTFSKLGKDLFGFVKGNIASLAGLAGLGTVGAMLKKGWDAKQVFEKNAIAIKAFAKSAGDVEPLLDNLKQLTFRNSEMGETASEASRKLLSAGYSGREAAALIKAFGAAAKASPEEATMVFDKLTDTVLELKNSGVAQAADFKKLQELGIPIYDLLAQRLSIVNKRMITSAEAAEMLQKGLISSKDAIIAIGMVAEDPRIKQLGDNLKNTIMGALKNIKGELNLAVGNFVDGFDAATGATSSFVRGLNRIADWIKQISPTSEMTARIIKDNWEGLGLFINDAGKMAFASFADGLNELKFWFQEGLSFISNLAGGAFSTLGGISDTASDFLNNLGATLKDVFGNAGDLAKTFGLDMDGVTNIWEGLYELVYSFWDMLKVGWIGIKSLGSEVINTWIGLTEKLVKKWDSVTNSFSDLLASAGMELGLVDEGTWRALQEDNKRREEDFKPDFGRLENNFDAEVMQEFEKQKKEREERKKQRQDRLKKQQDDLVAKGKAPGVEDLANMQNGKIIANEMAKMVAPALITRGGAEEYKLMVERQTETIAANQLKEQQKANDLLANINQNMEVMAVAAAPKALPVLGLIPQVV